MSLNNIGSKLFYIAKQGDVKKFLSVIEQEKVFNNLSKLNAKDSSQLIYSFSTLKIADKKIWKTLENLFLVQSKIMNDRDILFCASAFGKKSQNKQIWRSIEEHFGSHLRDFQDVRTIVTLFYAFANAQYQSTPLWRDLETITLSCLRKFGQKELAMLAWSFSRVGEGSAYFWDQLEKHIKTQVKYLTSQNLSIITYSFSKSRRGTSLFFEALENKVLSAILYDGNIAVKPKDIANIAWGFANLEYGSLQFWSQLEKFVVKIMPKCSLIDLANISWAFLQTKSNYPHFWPAFFSHLKNLEQIDEKYHQDVVVLAETLTKIDCQDQELWDKLGFTFLSFLRKGLMNDSMSRARWHRKYFELDPKSFDESVEEIYLQSIENSLNQDPALGIWCIWNICLCAFPNLGSEKFWDNLFKSFSRALEKPEILEKEESLNVLSNVIYVLNAKLALDPKKTNALRSRLNESLNTLYKKDENFLLLTKEKLNFFIQLKAFVLQSYNADKTVFWNQVKKHKDMFEFTSSDIKALIFAIIVKNSLFFDASKYADFEKILKDHFSASSSSKEEIHKLTQDLFTLLLKSHTDNQMIVQEFEQNPLTKNLNIQNFLKGKDETVQEDQVQREFKQLIQNYDKVQTLNYQEHK